MRKPVFLLLIFLQIYGLKSNSQPPVRTGSEIVGKNFAKNKAITAKTIIFPDRIDQVDLDSVSGYATVQLRSYSGDGRFLKKDGKIVMYDLASDKEKWTQKVNFHHDTLTQYGNCLIRKTDLKNIRLDMETGEISWEIPDRLFYFDLNRNKALGFLPESQYNTGDILQWFDLSTGKSKWWREVNPEYGCSSVYYLNDSTLMIVADGFYTANINTGKGWSYKTITGDKNTIDNNATDFAFSGAIFGFFIVPEHNYYGDLVSNVIADTSGFYFASRERIVRLDNSGKVIWVRPFSGSSSRSEIFLNNGRVYMINLAYGFLEGNEAAYGTPFIAAYDQKTGTPVFHNEIGKKKEMVRYCKYGKDTIFIVFKNRLAKFLTQKGSLISEKKFDWKDQWIKGLADSNLYQKSGPSFKSVIDIHPDDYLLMLNTQKVLVVDKNFEIRDTLENTSFYHKYYSHKGFQFLWKSGMTTVVDNTGQVVSELNFDDIIGRIKDRIYFFKGNHLLEIDLKEVVSGE